MSANLTPSQENYLEHIHRLARDGPVRVREIAEAAGVRLPSVTRAVARLAEAGLVRHQAYGAVEITPEGTRAARAVMRRDSCLQSLLVDVLGMDEEGARTEVCRLEHVLSTDVLIRLEALVSQATNPSSARWLGSLHRRIRKNVPEGKGARGAAVGNASLHGGGP